MTMKQSAQRMLLSGNEAIARGAYEAGVRFAASYPGTPSTEILETIAAHTDIECEWSPNEKVAVEVAFGAALGGVRAMASMKHVGLNVAADPLMTIAYTGINAGMVIVSADDPGMHSSQNEQDNRHYARFAKVPMLEPADSQECKDFTIEAFRISEEYDTPVLLRTTTRISHGKSLVAPGEPLGIEPRGFVRDQPKYVMIPAHARLRHVVVEERLKRLRDLANSTPLNRIEHADKSVGIIASGAAYQYVKEACPEASVLRLGMTYPFPDKVVRKFARSVDRLFVVEELDPFIEDQVRALGIECIGKERFSLLGELDPVLVAEGVNGRKKRRHSRAQTDGLPQRPPVMCPGCPHRGVFHVLRKLKVIATGDIGCYTLSVLPPLQMMDTCVCMGASVGSAHGLEKALGDASRIVGIIGDSTFVHGGITPLIDIAYNKGTSTIIILDNRTTAMTGHQDHPATGVTARGEQTFRLNLEALCRACGIEDVRVVDPYDLDAVEENVKAALANRAPSVIIADRPCPLLDRSAWGEPLTVEEDLCAACTVCLKLGCPAMTLGAEGPKGRRKARIVAEVCAGCALCARICPKGAIKPASRSKH
jgi:indolepyruvate ferredoxin oxidoreductase alpha subunit